MDVTLTRGRIFDSDATGLIADGEIGLFRSRLFDNAGGVVAGPGRLTLARTSIVRNRGPIGGIAATSAEVVLRRSTVGENASGGDGGGILLTGGARLEAANATIAANRAAGSGGGVFAGPSSQLSLNAVTVAANARPRRAAGSCSPGGRAQPSTTRCWQRTPPPVGADDCSGAGFESGGGNLISSAAGCLGFGNTRHRRLASRDRAARRQRRADLDGRPARSEPGARAAGGDAPARDQRNVDRRDPDAGAFERR